VPKWDSPWHPLESQRPDDASVRSSVVAPDGRERYPRTSRFRPGRCAGPLASCRQCRGRGRRRRWARRAGGLGEGFRPTPVAADQECNGRDIPNQRAGAFTLCPPYFAPVPARTRPGMPSRRGQHQRSPGNPEPRDNRADRAGMIALRPRSGKQPRRRAGIAGLSFGQPDDRRRKNRRERERRDVANRRDGVERMSKATVAAAAPRSRWRLQGTLAEPKR